MAKTDFDSDLVLQLAGLLDETGLTEIEYGKGDMHIRVSKGATSAAVQVAAPAPVATVPSPGLGGTPVPNGEADPASHPGAVTSPMVGVTYLKPDPDAAVFIKEGDRVTEGQTLLLIEAMKVFNPIHAPRAGTVTKIFIQDGSPVEYGEALVIIE